MKEENAFSGDFADAVKGISEIDYEYVNAIVEGDADLFRQLLQVAEKMLPNAIGKLDGFLAEDDLSGFTIEVHGLKGSLNSLGAQTLGIDAFELEKAAKDGDLKFCKENVDAFTTKLWAFYQSTVEALQENGKQKETGDAACLLEKLRAATKAAENFDNMSAFSIVKDLMRSSFGADIDRSLKAIEDALDEFECDTAAQQLKELMARIEKRD